VPPARLLTGRDRRFLTVGPLRPSGRVGDLGDVQHRRHTRGHYQCRGSKGRRQKGVCGECL